MHGWLPVLAASRVGPPRRLLFGQDGNLKTLPTWLMIGTKTLMRVLILRVLGVRSCSALFFDGRAWGHAQDLDLEDDASRMFISVPGPVQTVQGAEY